MAEQIKESFDEMKQSEKRTWFAEEQLKSKKMINDRNLLAKQVKEDGKIL